MSTLKNTPLEFIYKLTLSNNDEQFIDNFSIFMCFGIVITILQNLQGPLPYGKGSLITKNSFIQSINISISSKFTFRYAFLPTFFMPFLIFFLTPSQNLWNIVNFFSACIFTYHYFHRSIIYPSQMSPNAAPTPLLLFIMLSTMATAHSFYQAHHILNVLSAETYILTIPGMVMCVMGFWINSHHDAILMNLRSNNQTGKREYKIPRGFLFEYVSCANYFGEILEWSGLFLITLSKPQAILAGFTTVFLVLRAGYAHKFYKERFGNEYPKSRKAIIPFIY